MLLKQKLSAIGSWSVKNEIKNKMIEVQFFSCTGMSPFEIWLSGFKFKWLIVSICNSEPLGWTIFNYKLFCFCLRILWGSEVLQRKKNWKERIKYGLINFIKHFDKSANKIICLCNDKKNRSTCYVQYAMCTVYSLQT